MSGATKQFRAVMDELDALIKKEVLTPEELAAFKSKKELAQALKAQIEDEQAVEGLKAWAREPDGQTAVKPGWSGEAVGEGEGHIAGVTEDVRTGELYDTSTIGRDKLRALKSGAYKDALAAYIRGGEKKLSNSAMKVLMEGVDTAGGFWVSPDLRPQLIKKMMTVTGVQQDVNQFTTSKDVVSYPKTVYTTDNKYTSGVQISWTAENPAADISETTNPVAGRTNIPVHTATASVYLTREQTEDTDFDILGYVTQLIGEGFALGKDDSYINGSGLGQPQGILSHANATVAHNFTTGAGGMYVPSGVSAAVTWVGTSVGTAETNEGFVGTERALPPQYEQGAKWYGHKDVFAQARGLVDTTGRPVWLPADQFANASNGYQPTIFGYPIVRDNFVPVPAASSYSVILGNLQGYLAPQRVGISVEVLRELKALRGLVVVYARARFGGELAYDWQVKLMKLATS